MINKKRMKKCLFFASFSQMGIISSSSPTTTEKNNEEKNKRRATN